MESRTNRAGITTRRFYLDIITLFGTLIFFGVLLYIITLIPMDGTVRQIIIAIAILAIVLWVLQGFGVYHFGTVPTFRR